MIDLLGSSNGSRRRQFYLISGRSAGGPAGKLLFQLTGAFAEFRRFTIRQRAGRAWVIKQTIARRQVRE
jgi:hypothetical protein